MFSAQMSSAPVRFYMGANEMKDTFVPSGWNSIFIPTVPVGVLDTEYLTWVFEGLLNIGKVKRVDIVCKNKDKNQHMAFVHFESWNDSVATHNLRYMIEENNHVDVFGGDYNMPIHAQNPHLFLRLMVNNTPIKETEMNIHQLAANMEMAEATIADQRDTINNILKELADAKSRIESLEMIIESNHKNSGYTTPIKRIHIDTESGQLCNIPPPPLLKRQTNNYNPNKFWEFLESGQGAESLQLLTQKGALHPDEFGEMKDTTVAEAGAYNYQDIIKNNESNIIKQLYEQFCEEV